MPEIKLTRRYPESRLEDITDAFFRGFESGRSIDLDNSETLNKENCQLKLSNEALLQFAATLDEAIDSLRDMVKNMLPVVDCKSDVAFCPFFDECWHDRSPLEMQIKIMRGDCLFEKQARELGIEAPDAV